MTQYRRLRRPGATYFFTLCLQERGSDMLVLKIGALRAAYAATVAELPVQCHAMVILPDHLHAVWTEPDDAVCFSERWRRMKARFSHAVAGDFRPCASKVARRERGLWQRRFWEHALRDEAEFAAAIDLCRCDPVRHGLVDRPEDWPWSSFARRPGRGGRACDPAT